MSVLFHAEIVGRDFGSHLLSVAKLTAWAQNKDLELVTLPPIDGFRFVQVEALLCAIERAVSSSTKDHEAAAIVQSTPKLVQDRAAEIAPRWLVGADAHLQWRNLIKQAVQAGELSLLNYGSKLPIQKPDTQPQAAPEAAPVVQPDSITTKGVAINFDGLPYTAENWPKRLSGIAWLQSANTSRGEVGGITGLWCPLKLAVLIHGREKGREKQKTLEILNSRFKRNTALQPWRDAWNEHYALFTNTNND